MWRGRNAGLIRALAIQRVFEQGGRYTLRMLAERFGASERTIRRDIEALEASGLPLTTEPGTTRWKSGEWWLCR